jgi:monofunctional biosynthetic peptidoglycan transglycosylase
MGWVTAKLARQTRRRGIKQLILFGVGVLVVVDVIYILAIKPDWDTWKTGAPPRSVYMEDAGKIAWDVVPLATLPEHLQRAVIAAEDVRFHQHVGVDFAAIGEAAEYFREHRKIGFGASTISQQTVKNLVVGGARTPLRKWHEMVLALVMERNLSKNRILFLYLNIVELGRGVFGVEAAAKAYWNKSASELTVAQSIELAATLPSPRKHNPSTRTERFTARCEKIRGFMEQFGWAEKRAPSEPAAADVEAEAPPEKTEDEVEANTDDQDVGGATKAKVRGKRRAR